MIDMRCVHALALGLDRPWRRLPDREREADARAFVEAVEQPEQPEHPEQPGGHVRTFAYGTAGMRPGVDLLLWRAGPSIEALEEAAAAALRTGAGRWMHVVHSFVGLLQGSPYVQRQAPEQPALFTGERRPYLVVYPFTKDVEWYLTPREVRQGLMNEHMRVGHSYPQVHQLLANSFGLGDHDFLVAYETEDLDAFSSLVRDLRGTESRRSVLVDSPILLGVHRPLPDLMAQLGATATANGEAREPAALGHHG
ncbi:MAG TPA: chlorite dismutase family protein [Candidatus Binatia bacterium]|jgi:chlorite dismutase|nr:chlorite dismutase family protein [Candidatus Binatia bacterium]